jgi:hypothetical protein
MVQSRYLPGNPSPTDVYTASGDARCFCVDDESRIAADKKAGQRELDRGDLHALR